MADRSDGPYTDHLRERFREWRDVPAKCIKAAGPYNFRRPRGQLETAWLDTVTDPRSNGACILEMNGQRFAVVPWPEKK